MGKPHFNTKRNSKRNRGDNMVEFAIILPFFFLLMFGILDLGHLYWVQVTLENAVRQAGRFAVTGRSLPTMTRVASIKAIAEKAAPGFNLDPSQIIITSQLGGSSSTNSASAGGLPGDTVNISVTTHLGLFTPMIGRYFGQNGVDTFTVATTFRNERFPAGETQ